MTEDKNTITDGAVSLSKAPVEALVGKINRSRFMAFGNIAPMGSATSDYVLIGEGTTSASINYNPQTETTQSIISDTADTDVTSYQPTLPMSNMFIGGNKMDEFIEKLRLKRAVLGEATLDIVLVYIYGGSIDGDEYMAEQQKVSIQFDSFGGDGGGSLQSNYTYNFKGDAVLGTFNPSDRKFTAS